MKASIIIVSYNGRKYLEKCLGAISDLNFPKHQYETIVVDNGSIDGSPRLIREKYSWVKLIEAGANLGFSGGNNLGMKKARGDYFVLLNQDTIVQKDWLKELVETADKYQDVGLINSKLIFSYQLVPLRIKSDTFVLAEHTGTTDFRRLGVRLERIDLGDDELNQRLEYKDSFYPPENTTNRYYWTDGDALLCLPVVDFCLKLSMNICPDRPSRDLVTKVMLSIGDDVIFSGRLKFNESVYVDQKIPKLVIKKNAFNVIQNAGVVVFKDGHGRDRGEVIRGTQQLHELDKGQYDKSEEIFSVCGASCLIKRELIEDVGYFDERFFLYYEDVDLSWRARLRGWKVWYQPKSVVRHIHAASSGEWSSFFIFYTERNRLMVLLKNSTLGRFLLEFAKYLGLTMVTALKLVKQILKKNRAEAKKRSAKLKIRVGAIFSLFKNLPYLLKERFQIQGRKRKSIKEVEEMLY